MYKQTEYGLAWGLVFLFIVLAMLVVCVPRNRRRDAKPVDKRELAKQKALKKKKKAQAKRTKARNKMNKKKKK